MESNTIKYGKKRWLIHLKRKSLKYGYRPQKIAKKKNIFSVHIAPEQICLYKAEDEISASHEIVKKTLTFINKIRESKQTLIRISFRNTKRATAAASVLLYAAIEEAKDNGCKFEKLSSITNFQVNSYMKSIGVYNLIQARESVLNFSSEAPLPIIKGFDAEYRDEIVDYIKNIVFKNNLSPDDENKYGDAVQETISNVLLHAYPEIEESSNKKWWLLCDVLDKDLYLAIFDQGVGIPSTVSGNKWFGTTLASKYPSKYVEIMDELAITTTEKLQDKLGLLKLNDEQLIQLSMIGDITRTMESKHGQGSKSIKALVADNQDGKLWVFSNKGLYAMNGKSTLDSVHSLPISICGTIVQWNIKL